MAIDDNTSYELTGYQVKDLAGRIRRKADASAIPTVNDATLTLVQNGTTVGTFTANQSTNTTVNLAGGIYADDPTAPANPDGWIASGDVDWSTMPGSYSTTGQKTPFTWINGKPIYKKTVDIGALPNAAGKNVAHNISDLDFVIKIEGGAKASDGARIPLPYADITTAGTVGVFVNNTNIYVFDGQNRTSFSGYVTLWYTKTTD